MDLRDLDLDFFDFLDERLRPPAWTEPPRDDLRDLDFLDFLDERLRPPAWTEPPRDDLRDLDFLDFLDARRLRPPAWVATTAPPRMDFLDLGLRPLRFLPPA
jgi:hypothetical protein